MANDALTAGKGSMFIQFGANTQPYFLGCHSVDEISQSEGDKTLLWCQNPAGPIRRIRPFDRRSATT